MADFGSIVFISFPFTDLSATKLRPALVVSRDNERRADVVLAFITSKARIEEHPKFSEKYLKWKIYFMTYKEIPQLFLFP